MAGDEKFDLDDCIGSRVQIVLNKQSFASLNIPGINSPKFYARVLGYDSLGLWIENPHYCVTPAYDAEGNYIPPEQRKEECHRVAILLLWPFVHTIIAFPDVEEFMPEEPEALIGFTVVREREQELKEMQERAAVRGKKKK